MEGLLIAMHTCHDIVILMSQDRQELDEAIANVEAHGMAIEVSC